MLEICSTRFGSLISCKWIHPLVPNSCLLCLFSMKRVEAGGDWSLFCPNEAPGLHEVHSQEFEELFEKYEKEGRARKTIPAQKLWYAILEAQIETGNPFMLYKDHANGKLFQSLSTMNSLTRPSSQIQPKEPRYYQVIQPLHRDYRIFCP